jgi:hypothetical protein
MANTVQNAANFTINAGGTLGFNSNLSSTITGSIVCHTTFMSLSGSTYQIVPTGSFLTGTHYLGIVNLTSGSTVDLFCFNTGSANGVAKLAYNDGIVIPVYGTQNYWVREANTLTASLKVASCEF